LKESRSKAIDIFLANGDLRAMPYKGMDGRIDKPKAGGRQGLRSTFGNRTPLHIEGGKGAKPKVVKFRSRPDPLAR